MQQQNVPISTLVDMYKRSELQLPEIQRSANGYQSGKQTLVQPHTSQLFPVESQVGRQGRAGRHAGQQYFFSPEIFLIHQPLMREFNRYALARWCGVTEPSDGLLVLGIVCSVAVTLLAAVELHRMTKAFSSFLLRRRSFSEYEQQSIPSAGFTQSVRSLYGSPQGQRLRRSLRPARRAGTAVGRLLTGRTQG